MSQHATLLQDVHTAYRRYCHVTRARTLAAWLAIDLSLSQVQVLLILAHRETAFVSTVADDLGVGRSAASTLIDSLVRRGLACRSEDRADRRRTMVRLTAQGVACIDGLWQGAAAEIQHALASVEAADLRALHHGLKVLTAMASGPACDSTATAHAPAEEEPADLDAWRTG